MQTKLILFSLTSLLITVSLCLLMISASKSPDETYRLTTRYYQALQHDHITSRTDDIISNEHSSQNNVIANLYQQYPYMISWVRFIFLYGAFFLILPLIWSSLFNLSIPKAIRINTQERRTRYTMECLLFLLIQILFTSLLFSFLTPDMILYTWYLLPVLIIVPTCLLIGDWRLSRSMFNQANIHHRCLKVKALSSYLSHGFLCFALILFINVCLFNILPIHHTTYTDSATLYKVNLSAYPAFLSLIFVVMTITRFPIITLKDASFHFNTNALYPAGISAIFFVWYLSSSSRIFE